MKRRVYSVAFILFAVVVAILWRFGEKEPPETAATEDALVAESRLSPEPWLILIDDGSASGTIVWEYPREVGDKDQIPKPNPISILKATRMIGDFPPYLPGGQQETYDRLQRGGVREIGSDPLLPRHAARVPGIIDRGETSAHDTSGDA